MCWVKRLKVSGFVWLTCGDATAEQGEVFGGETVIGGTKLDDTSGIHHRVLRERGSVQEMEDGFSINGWESGSAISFHHLLHGVHPIPLTQVALLALAVATLSTLPIENWHHYVPFLHLTHPFAHTLHNPTHTNPVHLNHHRQFSTTISSIKNTFLKLMINILSKKASG